MDKRFKRRWIAALRSGKYKQGRGGLKKGDKFCCLGVACDISGDVAWEGAYAVAWGTSSRVCLPDNFRARLGLSYCAECYAPWPCTMSRALDQVEEMKEALLAVRQFFAARDSVVHCVEAALSLRHLVGGKGE